MLCCVVGERGNEREERESGERDGGERERD